MFASLLAQEDGLSSGNADAADVFFLIAVILFALYALIGFFAALDVRVHNLLLGAGLACVALAWLLL